MKLIPELAGGVEGAGNGTAEIYVRGTGTRATYYTDFDGDTSVTNGADVVLDANGQATVYVNQYVDVIVKSSTAVTIQSFTVMDQATALEVMSQSFTGVDYDTAASAAGNPATLKTVLDLWVTNNGAIDWEILFQGAPATIQAALATVVLGYFNVKAPAYGAVGNGVTNDLAAIQDAADAAEAAGGGVLFFPPGTYLISAELQISDRVSILGSGQRCTEIRSTSATNNIITQTASGAGRGNPSIQDIVLRHSVGSTGTLVAVETTMSMLRVNLGGSTNEAGSAITIAASGIVKVVDCAIATSVSTNQVVAGDLTAQFFASGLSTTFHSTGFAPTTGAFYVGEMRFSNCRFQAFASAVNPYVWIPIDGTGVLRVSVVGCTFLGVGIGETGVCFGLGTLTATHNLTETGNLFGTSSANGITAYSFTQANVTPAGLCLGSREGRRLDVSSDAASLTLNPLYNDFITITRSANTAMTATIADAPSGTEFWLLYFAGGSANTAAVLTIAATSATVRGTSSFTPSDAADRAVLFHCKKLHINSVHSWSVLAHSSQWVN